VSKQWCRQRGGSGIGREDHAQEDDGTALAVRGYMDAQNSFGAKLRNQFVVFLRKDGAGLTATKVMLGALSDPGELKSGAGPLGRRSPLPTRPPREEPVSLALAFNR